MDDEALIEAGRRAMIARRWTLFQTLAWISTRHPEAVGLDNDEATVEAWMAVEAVLNSEARFPFPRRGDAWQALAEAMADGAIGGLGTRVRMGRDGGFTPHAQGVPFPPPDQPGFALQCDVFYEGESVIATKERPFAQVWIEFQNVSFRREDVMREFPAGAVATAGEVERQSNDRLCIEGPSVEKPESSGSNIASRTRRGNKPKFDWPEYERQYSARIAVDGAPDLQNVEGWQIQADVARWLQGLAERDGQIMSPDVAKRAARKLMVLIGA